MFVEHIHQLCQFTLTLANYLVPWTPPSQSWPDSAKVGLISAYILICESQACTHQTEASDDVCVFWVKRLSLRINHYCANRSNPWGSYRKVLCFCQVRKLHTERKKGYCEVMSKHKRIQYVDTITCDEFHYLR